MNISVFIGLIIAFGGIITGYIMDKGNLAALISLSPFLIVVVGTWGAVISSFGLGQVADSFKAFFQTLSSKNKPDPEKLIKKLSEMSDKCRKEGLLTLQTMMNDSDLSSKQYLLLKEGMLLTMDMKNADMIQEVLDSDIKAFSLKRQMQIEVFDGAGGFSPTLGIIGTVMGLVQVLSHMDSTGGGMTELTASIAGAFIATLYGIIFANLIYFPMANQLKGDLKRQKIFKQMMVDGITMVASGESARNLENKLSLYYQAFPKGDQKYEAGINN